MSRVRERRRTTVRSVHGFDSSMSTPRLLESLETHTSLGERLLKTPTSLAQRLQQTLTSLLEAQRLLHNPTFLEAERLLQNHTSLPQQLLLSNGVTMLNSTLPTTSSLGPLLEGSGRTRITDLTSKTASVTVSRC